MSQKMIFFSRELRDQTAQGSERIWIMLPSSLIISYCSAVKKSYSKQKLFAHIINFRPDRPRSLPRSPKHRLLICYECGWSKRSSSVTSPSEIYCISTYFLFPGHKQKEKEKYAYRTSHFTQSNHCVSYVPFSTLRRTSYSGP